MQNSKSKKDLAFEQERVKFKRHIRSLEGEIRELKVLLSDVEFQAAKHAALNSSLMDDMFKLKEFIGLSEEQQKYILGYIKYEMELDKLRDVASLYPNPYQAQMLGSFGLAERSRSFINQCYGVASVRSDVKAEISVDGLRPSYILDENTFDLKRWERVNALPKKYINAGIDLASGPDKSGTINIGAVSHGRKNFAQRLKEGDDEKKEEK